MDDACCLLFRNLKRNMTYGSLKVSLLQLLNEIVLLDVPLRERDITIEGDAHETKIALVYLRNKRDLDKTLKYVDSYDNRRRLTFNFDDIIEPLAHCAVIPVFNRPSKYYIEGEVLPNIDGANEFKSGAGAYVNVYMREDLSKFICACLNGEMERKFFVGVQENGSVVGVPMVPPKEDILRKDVIERAIADIRPPIMPWNYKAEFLPVLANGIVKDGIKVIEITINQIEHLTELYEVKGDFYIRRDGGKTECMRPKDVQQWYQYMYSRDMKKKDEERELVLEKIDATSGSGCEIL